MKMFLFPISVECVQSTILSQLILLILIKSVITSDTSLDHPFTQSFTKLSHAACVALYFRNGRVGCGTDDRSLNIGELYYFQGSLPDNRENSYVMVVEDYDLTADTIATLSAAADGKLRGVLIVNSTKSSSDGSYISGSQDTNTYLSPASKTPQGYNTPSADLNYGYNAYQWNPKGEGLLDMNLIGMPMAYISNSDVASSLRQESQKNEGNSAVVAEFNYYMGPDGINSKDCLQWKDAASEEWNPKCLPLGGTSVWALAGSPPEVNYNNARDRSLKSEQANSNLQRRNLANKRSVVMLAAGMDTTSMFHDASPGANTAASNILAIVMASKLIGLNMNDQVLDNLPKRIALALFEGESYGFLGSRSFLRDLAYPGFKCNSAPVRAVPRLGEKSDYACLYPLRQSLKFADIGQIVGMISVDQIGHGVSDGILYVHADQKNDEYGTYLANIMKYSATSDYSVAFSSVANNNNNNGYPYPPSPVTSLLNLSGGTYGGIILTGYDYAFSGKVPFQSHRDSAAVAYINLKSIAGAATILARTVVAAAYDDGSDENGGYQNSAYYAKNIIPELSSNDEDLLELSSCLFYGTSCSFFNKFSDVEAANERGKTGLNLPNSEAFPNPPSFYVGVYSGSSGQPFVQVGDNIFGSYDGNDFGQRSSDAIGILPRQLESVIHGMFNDYLGRGSGDSGNSASCKKASDCAKLDICQAYGDLATCTGRGQCVCRRAHYHVAVDEAVSPVSNLPTGYFEIDENDAGVSALYTEPFWSPNIGIRVYRDVGSLPGFFTLVAGVAVGIASLFGALVLKVGLKKEKLY
jgi:nicastrin